MHMRETLNPRRKGSLHPVPLETTPEKLSLRTAPKSRSPYPPQLRPAFASLASKPAARTVSRKREIDLSSMPIESGRQLFPGEVAAFPAIFVDWLRRVSDRSSPVAWWLVRRCVYAVYTCVGGGGWSDGAEGRRCKSNDRGWPESTGRGDEKGATKAARGTRTRVKIRKIGRCAGATLWNYFAERRFLVPTVGRPPDRLSGVANFPEPTG